MDSTPNATACAEFVDQIALSGTDAAFFAPGSRSTPLLLALDADPRIQVHMFHDERSAAFAALGHGLATGRPAIVLCTSGTAGTHFHAAVVEADLSAVPMIVCTADRPPRLWDRGAPQTINQTELYGGAVRLFAEPGPPAADNPTNWRELANELFTFSSGADGARPGPVHANLSFDEPLVGEPEPLGPSLAPAAGDSPVAAELADLQQLAKRLAGSSGVIIAGRGITDPADLHRLAAKLGWPVIADHQSGARTDSTINHADLILRCPEFADAQRPDFVLRFGEALSSKALAQWLSAAHHDGTTVVGIHQPGRLIDPEIVVDQALPEAGTAMALTALVEAAAPSGQAWTEADGKARAAVAEHLDPAGEAGIALAALHAAGPNGAVVAASSMPIRYLEWLDSSPPQGTVVASNRGANGIDGTIATAVGIALTGTPTVCVLGDVAFLHDSTSLIGLAERDIDLTIAVIDNNGGGIFSFLPQADVLAEDRFDRLFGTPHNTDLAALAEANGVATGGDLMPDGVRVVVHKVADRPSHVDELRRTVAAVASTLSP